MYNTYMSIITMQKKIKATKNISNKDVGFSLKGTRRNLGRIGSDSKNSVIRTIFKGSEPVGNGSNNNTGYPVEILCNNGSNCIGSSCEPNSTLNNKGYIESHIINNTNCGVNCTEKWVKSFNPEEHSQSSYIRRLKVHKAGCENYPKDLVQLVNTTCDDDCKDTYFIGTRKILRATHHQDVNKGAIPSSEYTDINLLRNNCLPDAACKRQFPFVLTTNGCRTEYYAPEEAIKDGLLPEDWMKCKTKYPTSQFFISNPYD